MYGGGNRRRKMGCKDNKILYRNDIEDRVIKRSTGVAMRKDIWWHLTNMILTSH